MITSSFSNASEMSTDDVTRPPVAGDQATDTDDKAVGVARYRRACERLQTTVSTGFLSQLGRRHVRLRDAKLSPAQLKAVCIALTVSTSSLLHGQPLRRSLDRLVTPQRPMPGDKHG